jgi:hypothetical protein
LQKLLACNWAFGTTETSSLAALESNECSFLGPINTSNTENEHNLVWGNLQILKGGDALENFRGKCFKKVGVKIPGEVKQVSV